ncbi:YiaA/YiaB family inner membrane protein, partial [Shigella sonnei]|uniref:YiaA/YiaB family inner membrane protein n=1 Tax=Shigella sonnei TaxID=624 RepID=UPI0020A64C7F
QGKISSDGCLKKEQMVVSAIASTPQWNATLLLSEKGFYGLAFFLSLFGAVAVQKNIRDAGINPPKETQVTQEEYSE